MVESMLSTKDNPFNPFDDWDQWYAFDESKGYDTTGFLARLVNGSDDLSDADQREAINETIDEIVKENVSGVYIKITRSL
jgi:hypothetical protein